MSELYPRHTIITIDREDFEIYRRNKHDRIPFIAPPVNEARPRMICARPSTPALGIIRQLPVRVRR